MISITKAIITHSRSGISGVSAWFGSWPSSCCWTRCWSDSAASTVGQCSGFGPVFNWSSYSSSLACPSIEWTAPGRPPVLLGLLQWYVYYAGNEWSCSDFKQAAIKFIVHISYAGYSLTGCSTNDSLGPELEPSSALFGPVDLQNWKGLTQYLAKSCFYIETRFDRKRSSKQCSAGSCD